MLQTTTAQTRSSKLLIGPLMDRDLQKAYRAFERAHAAMVASATKEADNGSIPNSTPEERAAHKKNVRAMNRAFEAAYAVMQAPCSTIEGMLLKIQVAGFCVADTRGKPLPFVGEPEWTMEHVGFFSEPEVADMLCTLRDDLRRLQRTAQN